MAEFDDFWYIGRGHEYLDRMSDSTKESRPLFLGFCKSQQVSLLNSMFHKPPQKLVTYKEKVPNGGNEMINGPPYNAIKYGQVDFWLASDLGRKRP